MVPLCVSAHSLSRGMLSRVRIGCRRQWRVLLDKWWTPAGSAVGLDHRQTLNWKLQYPQGTGVFLCLRFSFGDNCQRKSGAFYYLIFVAGFSCWYLFGIWLARNKTDSGLLLGFSLLSFLYRQVGQEKEPFIWCLLIALLDKAAQIKKVIKAVAKRMKVYSMRLPDRGKGQGNEILDLKLIVLMKAIWVR